MQTLFAYKQRVQANHELAEDHIKKVFSPDLNSMEFQDHESLASDQKIALELYGDQMIISDDSKIPDNKVGKVVSESIKSLFDQNTADARQIRKQILSDVDKLFHTYISFLDLLIALQEQATLDSKRNHSRFVKNLLINGLKLNKSLKKAILASGSKWRNQPEVKEWLRTFISKDPVYQEYNDQADGTFKMDYDFIKYLVNKVIFKNEVTETFLEENDLFWDENRIIIKSLLMKTLKSIEETEPEDFDLQEVSYNFEEDREFFVKLFDSTLALPEELQILIGEKAVNWDMERLALTDKVVIEMAIAELINFPSIPVKVTINEYIEVSKKYSTPKSKQFINGILDVIAEDLKTKGILKKSGRGLIDNK